VRSSEFVSPVTAALTLIETGPLDGRANMAFDEALLAARLPGPVLRLYAWDGPWISLGWFQKIEEAVDLEGARAQGVGVVRRPTGGKALVHEGDLTYALVLPAGHPLTRASVVASYRIILRPLLEALGELGIRVQLNAPESRSDRTAVPCFMERAAESIVVGGRKLCGSAQVRRGGALLQHGSIPLVAPRPERIALLVPGASKAVIERYMERTTWLAREAPAVGASELKMALRRAFLRAFDEGSIAVRRSGRATAGTLRPCESHDEGRAV
jgi:lipoate-protein ligase A